jgi:hypothetical protein
MAAKVVIVLGAFPVLVHAVFTGGTMLLDVVLPSILELAGNRAELVSKGVVVAMFLVAVRFAFGVCRRLWPAAIAR